MSDQPFTSGDWVVKQGSEQEFIERWSDFAQWAKGNASGAGSFWLIQEKEEPSHFISFGSWADDDSVQSWRSGPEFPTRLGHVREVCDQFVAKDFHLVAGSEE
jgi:heme-degrading monooxygenase HmoA